MNTIETKYVKYATKTCKTSFLLTPTAKCFPGYRCRVKAIGIGRGEEREWECARVILLQRTPPRLWKSAIGYTSIQPGLYPSDPPAYVH